MFVSKVRTASGAGAVQVMCKSGRRNVLVEPVGSAHTDADAGRLMDRARRIVTGDQGVVTETVAGFITISAQEQALEADQSSVRKYRKSACPSVLTIL